jgi:hypothetical protein
MIITLLLQEVYTSAFISDGFLDYLPLGIPSYSDSVFDILMIVISQKPTFDCRFATHFKKQIPLNPRKAFTVIAKFALSFATVDDPWPLLDLLFKFWDVLATPDTAIDYIALHVFLCREFVNFRVH